MEDTKEKEQLCLNCLECCRYLEFGINIPKYVDTANLEKFYADHYCKTKVIEDRRSKTMFVLIPCQCKNLTPFGCQIYEDRFDLCRRYDGRRDVLMAGMCKWKDLKET